MAESVVPPLNADQITILRRRVEQAEGLDVVMSRADMLRLFATLDARRDDD